MRPHTSHLLASLTMAVLLIGPSVSGAIGSDNPWLETAKIRDSDPNRNDHFGATVAIDGDTMVVGHPLEHNKTGLPFYGHDRGAVTVYEQEDGDWVEQETFLGPAPNSRFGSSIALDGDTFVTNAPSIEVSDGSRAWCPYSTAQLYVYEQKNGQWQRSETLRPSGHRAHDSCLGGDDGQSSLALDGSLLAAGAPGSHGTVLVYRYDAGAWNQEATLVAPDQGRYHSVGEAIAVSQEAGRVAVGHPSSGGQPAVDIFEQEADEWIYRTSIDGCCDWTGMSLDLDGVGSRVVAAGSPWFDEAPVQIWERTKNGWTSAGQLRLQDLNNARVRVSDLSLSTDGDRLAVGAWFDDVTPSLAPDQRSQVPIGIATIRTGTAPERLASPFGNGAVYLFQETSDGWQQTQKITQTDDAGADAFGWGVALDDSGDRLVVGAPGHTTPQDRAHVEPQGPREDRIRRHATSCCHGAAYVYNPVDTPGIPPNDPSGGVLS